MKDVTLIVTTFERPRKIMRFLRSVRRFYPEIDIIVADNGKDRPALFRELVTKYRSIYLKLDFDSGVSVSRNEALDMAMTKYAVICDDDFEFTEQTNLGNFRKVLDQDERVGVIAGELIYNGKQRRYIHKLVVNEENKWYMLLELVDPEWIDEDGVKYCYVDHGYQFYMIRNVPEIRWDGDLKCQWEHLELSLRLKREGKWRMAYTPDVVANHSAGKQSKYYTRFRLRTDDWERFYRKTGFKGNVGGVEQPAVDSKGKRIVPFPEYVFFLLKARSKAVAMQANPERPLNNQIGGK